MIADRLIAFPLSCDFVFFVPWDCVCLASMRRISLPASSVEKWMMLCPSIFFLSTSILPSPHNTGLLYHGRVLTMAQLPEKNNSTDARTITLSGEVASMLIGQVLSVSVASELDQLVLYYNMDQPGVVLKDLTGNGFDIEASTRYSFHIGTRLVLYGCVYACRIGA